MFRNFLLSSLAAVLVAPALGATWMTDLPAAQAKAKEAGKAVLVEFTGSDWCGACIQLRRTVLDAPGFDAYAKDKFVLMEVDVPKRKKLPGDLLERNRALCARYAVEAYPTLLVMEADGRVLGGVVGGRDLATLTRQLDDALANAARLDAAEALEGEARVRALYAVYVTLPKEIKAASGLRERISELDATGLTPLGEQLQAEKQLAELKRRLSAAGLDHAARLRVVEEMMPEVLPPNRSKFIEMRKHLRQMAEGRN